MINGIVVTENEEQAKARTVGKIARGAEFAECAMEMAWHAAVLLDEITESQESEEGEK
jgi:6,7-dimethyl-8-ribityllumazine synthase